MTVDATTQLQHYDLIIGGENVPATSGETFDTVSPTTNEPVGRMARAGVEDVDRAVAAARQAFDEGTLAAHDAAGAVAHHAQGRDDLA